MPVVPVNFRGGADFQPLDDVKNIIKFDGVVPAAVATRVQDGTWVQWGATGAIKPPAFGTPLLGVKGGFCSFSDFDPADTVGHPDSSRLGQITLLVGQYRGRTRYHLSAGSANITVAAAPATSTAIAAGSFLGISAADAATVTRITGAAPIGNGDATSCIAGDGVLFTTGNIAREEAVAIALTAQSATDGTIEYMML